MFSHWFPSKQFHTKHFSQYSWKLLRGSGKSLFLSKLKAPLFTLDFTSHAPLLLSTSAVVGWNHLQDITVTLRKTTGEKEEERNLFYFSGGEIPHLILVLIPNSYNAFSLHPLPLREQLSKRCHILGSCGFTTPISSSLRGCPGCLWGSKPASSHYPTARKCKWEVSWEAEEGRGLPCRVWWEANQRQIHLPSHNLHSIRSSGLKTEKPGFSGRCPWQGDGN